MFTFLSKLLSKRRARRIREIFAFWDGCRERKADPLAIWRALNDHPQFVVDQHLPAVERGDLAAIGITVNAVRGAFGVATLEGGGLTDQECLELLAGFLLWVADQKKSTNFPPILPSATALESSGTSTTPLTVDSSGIASAPNCGTPGASS